MGGCSYWYWQTNEESDGTRVNPHYVLNDKSGQGARKSGLQSFILKNRAGSRRVGGCGVPY